MVNFPENWCFGILPEPRNFLELVLRDVDLTATFGRIISACAQIGDMYTAAVENKPPMDCDKQKIKVDNLRVPGF